MLVVILVGQLIQDIKSYRYIEELSEITLACYVNLAAASASTGMYAGSQWPKNGLGEKKSIDIQLANLDR